MSESQYLVTKLVVQSNGITLNRLSALVGNILGKEMIDMVVKSLCSPGYFHDFSSLMTLAEDRIEIRRDTRPINHESLLDLYSQLMVTLVWNEFGSTLQQFDASPKEVSEIEKESVIVRHLKRSTSASLDELRGLFKRAPDLYRTLDNLTKRGFVSFASDRFHYSD